MRVSQSVKSRAKTIRAVSCVFFMSIFSLVLFQQQYENQADEDDRQDDANGCQALRDEGVSLIAEFVVFLHWACHAGWDQALAVSVPYPSQGGAPVRWGVEPLPDRGRLEAAKAGGGFLFHIALAFACVHTAPPGSGFWPRRSGWSILPARQSRQAISLA